jgi:hypothetical protein
LHKTPCMFETQLVQLQETFTYILETSLWRRSKVEGKNKRMNLLRLFVLSQPCRSVPASHRIERHKEENMLDLSAWRLKVFGTRSRPQLPLLLESREIRDFVLFPSLIVYQS